MTALEGRFSFALSGGETPRRLYSILAENYRDAVPWHAVHVFWADERCVPSTHPDSNFKMASDELLSRVLIPEENVHRILGEMPPSEAAAAYAATLADFFGDSEPKLDMILLGMGADGHTASLFSDSAPHPVGPWVAHVQAPPAMAVRDRVTLTLSTINAATRVWFLVTGKRKRPALEAVLGGSQPARQQLPAARVYPRGEVVWFVDEAAAGESDS